MCAGDRSDPEIASWLEWRAKNKPTKPILASINRPPAPFASLAAGVNRAVPAKPSQPPLQQQPPVVAAPPPKQPVVLPSRPSIITTAAPTAVQTVRSAGLAVTAGRTIATTTLTAAQLQQLAAARGQVFSAIQSQLKAGTASFTMAGGGVRQVGTVARPAQLLSGQALVRGQTGLIVSQQPRAHTVTVQRPQVGGLVVVIEFYNQFILKSQTLRAPLKNV